MNMRLIRYIMKTIEDDDYKNALEKNTDKKNMNN